MGFVKERGLVLEIPRETEEQDFIAKLHNLPGVTSLNSKYGLYMSNAALLEVGRNCKDLASLSVDWLFRNVSRKPLHKTLKCLKKLRRLSLQTLFLKSKDIVNDSTLKIIGAYNKELEDLDLTCSYETSDSGIRRLTQSLQSLKRLN